MSDLREALKPCPFCGGEPDIRTRQDEDIWTHNTVTWTGVLGDTAPNLAVLLSASPASNLYYNFFRILMRGVRDVHVPDPGPYKSPPLDLDVNPVNYLSPAVLLRDLAPNAHCNILVCRQPQPN